MMTPAKGTVTPNIQFIAPVKQFLMLDFEIVRQGLVVEGILQTRELYLRSLVRLPRAQRPATRLTSRESHDLSASDVGGIGGGILPPACLTPHSTIARRTGRRSSPFAVS